MEFTFSDFQGRLVLNATDIILHLEESKTARIYTQTFFDRDFPEVAQLGSLEFVSKILQSVFWKDKAQPGLSISLLHQTPSEISLLIRYTLPLLVKPIELTLNLPAVRRQTGGADMQDLDKKLKETVGRVDALEPLQQKLEPKFTAMEKTFETFLTRIKDLEERTGDYIVLPGCDFAIPTSLTSLKLVRSGTATLDNFYYSVAYPQMKCQAIASQYNQVLFNEGQPFGPANAQGMCCWQSDPGSFAIHSQCIKAGQHVLGGRLTPRTGFNYIDLKNIKHLKYLTSFTLAGIPVSDSEISILESMQYLTHLTIIGSRKVEFTGQPASAKNVANPGIPGVPTITHLNWIKSLKNLQSLVLVGSTSLTDITTLKDLPNLRELDIRETGVKNTDFLTNSSLKITK